MRSYGEDGGRPAGVGRQGQASNRPERLWSRAMVVSVGETSERDSGQVGHRKTNESEPPPRRRETEHGIETWPPECCGISPGVDLKAARAVSGVQGA